MSRSKLLNGVARNVAHKFSASAHHFAYMAYMHRIPSIRIDLLSGMINSEIFHIDRNNILIRMCMDNLQTMLSGIRMNSEVIKGAFLNVNFDISSSISTENPLEHVRCEFEVKLFHSNGKQFVGVIKDNVLIHS